MTITHETDVRKIMRDFFPDRLMFVEAARGGTDGYPDMTILHRSASHFCELKRGELAEYLDADNKLRRGLKIHLRTGQKQVIRLCAAQGIHIHIVGGEIGTKDALWYSRGIDCIKDFILRVPFRTAGVLEAFIETPFADRLPFPHVSNGVQ